MATFRDTDTVKIRLDSMAAERGRGMEGAIRAANVVQEDKGEKILVITILIWVLGVSKFVFLIGDIDVSRDVTVIEVKEASIPLDWKVQAGINFVSGC